MSNPEQTISSYGNASVMSDYLIHSQPVVGEVETTVLINIDVQECVPIWIVIVCVIGALVLLAVAVVILYMVSQLVEYCYAVCIPSGHLVNCLKRLFVVSDRFLQTAS